MALNTDDLIQIQQLYARYNTAIDTGDAPSFGACFVADGVFNPGHALLEGVDAISEFATKTHDAMPSMRHNATNLVIEGDADTATGSAFLIGYLAGGEYKVIVTGRYTDQLTKTADGWLFTNRQFAADA
jgi:uncharacterized protein (TIGR02246 family)